MNAGMVRDLRMSNSMLKNMRVVGGGARGDLDKSEHLVQDIASDILSKVTWNLVEIYRLLAKVPDVVRACAALF